MSIDPTGDPFTDDQQGQGPGRAIGSDLPQILMIAGLSLFFCFRDPRGGNAGPVSADGAKLASGCGQRRSGFFRVPDSWGGPARVGGIA